MLYARSRVFVDILSTLNRRKRVTRSYEKVLSTLNRRRRVARSRRLLSNSSTHPRVSTRKSMTCQSVSVEHTIRHLLLPTPLGFITRWSTEVNGIEY